MLTPSAQMSTIQSMSIPNTLPFIEDATKSLGFAMASERNTGALLRVLAASKPGGKLLELGTGTGLSACWLLDGMDTEAHLLTVDNDESVLKVARQYFGEDPRITITCADGGEYLESLNGQKFDLIFADAWPGKFFDLDVALALLNLGGIYVIDDLLPQPSWPDDHAPKVPKLIAALQARKELVVVEMEWATGILIATRIQH